MYFGWLPRPAKDMTLTFPWIVPEKFGASVFGFPRWASIYACSSPIAFQQGRTILSSLPLRPYYPIHSVSQIVEMPMWAGEINPWHSCIHQALKEGAQHFWVNVPCKPCMLQRLKREISPAGKAASPWKTSLLPLSQFQMTHCLVVSF